MTGKFENQILFSGRRIVCARGVVRIDQFVVFCCWLVLFCMSIATFIDTSHAQNALR